MEPAVPTAAEGSPPNSAARDLEPHSAPHRGRGAWLAVRAIISAVLAVLVLSAGVFVFVLLASAKKAPPREDPTPPVLRVEAFIVERTDLKRFVSGFGTARADHEVIVSAEVAGRVTEVVNLNIGREVHGATVSVAPDGTSIRHPGEVLAQIDPQTYEERLDQVHALLMQDQTAQELLKQEHATNLELLEQQQRRLATIQREFQRREQLLAQGAGAETEMERAKLELEQYRETQIRLQKEIQLFPLRQQEIQTRMNSHKSDLKLAELDLEKATVRAPFTGQLSQVFVEEGQYARVGDRLVQITDVNQIEVPIPLSLESAAAVELLIRTGQIVHAELARREEDFIQEGASVWAGKVTRIDPLADERTRTVQVFVEVRNDEQEVPLRPGSFVYARLQAGVIPASQGVLVPRDAIVNGHVYVAQPISDATQEAAGADQPRPRKFNAVATVRDVVVRDVYQTFALIQSGLQAGDKVVMTNLDIMQPDSRLDVHDEHTLAQEFQRLRIPYLQRLTTSSAARP